MRRAIYAARYLSDPDYRRKISRQLNKGESIHALIGTQTLRHPRGLSPAPSHATTTPHSDLTTIGASTR